MGKLHRLAYVQACAITLFYYFSWRFLRQKSRYFTSYITPFESAISFALFMQSFVFFVQLVAICFFIFILTHFFSFLRHPLLVKVFFFLSKTYSSWIHHPHFFFIFCGVVSCHGCEHHTCKKMEYVCVCAWDHVKIGIVLFMLAALI